MNSDKQTIFIDKCIGSEKNQLLIEGEIIVPDMLPDISHILKTDATAIISSFEIINERLNFKGSLKIEVLYLSNDSSSCVHNMSGTNQINDFLVIEGAKEGMWIDLKAKLSDISFEIINDRKLGYKAVVDIIATVTQKEEYTVIKDLIGSPEICHKTRELELENIICQKKDSFSIKEQLKAQHSDLSPEDIIEISADISGKHIKPADDNIGISGEINVLCLYRKTDTESQSIIDSIEAVIPFNGAFSVAGVNEDSNCRVDLFIEGKRFNIEQGEDSSKPCINLELDIGAHICAKQKNTVKLLADAYCLSEDIITVGEEVFCPYTLCRGINQFTIKESAAPDKNGPKILRVVNVSAKPYIDYINCNDGIIQIDGYIDAAIVYVVKDDNQPIYSFNTQLGFSQSIEAKGADSKMQIQANASLEHISYNLLSEDELDLRFIVECEYEVCAVMPQLLITDIKPDEESNSLKDTICGITIYIVKNGDTLWNIAKRFSTTVEDILALNPIENPDLIYPNQRLIILKKVVV